MREAPARCVRWARPALALAVAAGIAACEATPERRTLIPRIRLADAEARQAGWREPAVATIADVTRYVMGLHVIVPLLVRTPRKSLRSDADGAMSIDVVCPEVVPERHAVAFDLATIDRGADIPLQHTERLFGPLCRGVAGSTRQVRLQGLVPDRPFFVTAELSPEPPRVATAPFVDLPEHGELRLALGVRANGTLTPAPIDAIVTARAPDGRTRRLERRIVPPEATTPPGGWTEWRVPLDGARSELGRRVSLTMEAASRTENDGYIHVVWGDPTIWAPREAPRAENARNVILVSLDTFRADRLSAAGFPLDVTPNIDGVARDGVLFADAVSSANWTKPAHATMLTGTHPCVHRAGLQQGDHPLPAGVMPLAEHLRLVGYETAAFTEDALVSADTFQRGFGVFQARTKVDVLGPLGSVEDTVASANAWLTDHAEVPFLLFVHTYQAHAPYDPPARYESVVPAGMVPPLPGLPPPAPAAMGDAASYVGEIAFTDEVLGRLLAHVDALGLRSRTILVVTSDHGEAFGEHGTRYHGFGLLREEIRVPLVIRAPGIVAAGRRVESMVGLVDLTPTLLELLDLPRTEWMQGIGLRASLAPDGDRRPPAGRILPIRGFFQKGARGDDWRVRLGKDPKRWNLVEDPGEQRPRAATPAESALIRQTLARACGPARRLVDEAAAHMGVPRDGALSIDEQLRLRALGYLD